jgi:periplasmic copper chaperone A
MRYRPLSAARRRRASLALLALLGPFAACLLLAQDAGAAAAAPLVTVADAWVRGTVEGQTGSGAYMRLTSREDARLVGASSPVADRVEIHEMRMVNDMMTMRQIQSLPLPANTLVALDHDYHVMLIGLRQQLKTGQSVVLTLHLIDAAGAPHDLDVVAPVRPLNAGAARRE